MAVSRVESLRQGNAKRSIGIVKNSDGIGMKRKEWQRQERE